jgi:hypothetical protein
VTRSPAPTSSSAKLPDKSISPRRYVSVNTAPPSVATVALLLRRDELLAALAVRVDDELISADKHPLVYIIIYLSRHRYLIDE